MLRYALFAGLNYYPCRGWDDFVDAHNDVEQLKELGENRIDASAFRDGYSEWYQVVDLETRTIVYEGSI